MGESETEINRWIKMREDMQNSMLTMDDVADDPAYLCFSAGNNEDSRPGSVGAIASKFGERGDSRSESRADMESGRRDSVKSEEEQDNTQREQTPMPEMNAEPESEAES